MSRKSATDTIKRLNPKNISGTIPQALDLIQNLEKIKFGQNPKIFNAVGASQLMGMLKFIQSVFKKNKPTKDQTQSQADEEARLKALEDAIAKDAEEALRKLSTTNG